MFADVNSLFLRHLYQPFNKYGELSCFLANFFLFIYSFFFLIIYLFDINLRILLFSRIKIVEQHFESMMKHVVERIMVRIHFEIFENNPTYGREI